LSKKIKFFPGIVLFGAKSFSEKIFSSKVAITKQIFSKFYNARLT
jgi:hypothetical protein